MARTPLPRFLADVVVTVELAGTDLDDAYARLRELGPVVERAVKPAVRAHGSRTARVVRVDVDPAGHGPDTLAQQ